MVDNNDNKKCKTCFYSELYGGIHPCVDCFNYDKWVKRDLYIKDATQPLSEAIKEWVDVKESDQETEEFFVRMKGETVVSDYDVVSKPRHYMLFEDKGIEVRDVIEALLKKMQVGGEGCLGYSAMMYSDYAQLMQYLMRFMDKNGLEDLKKARQYLDWMIEYYE